MPSSIFYFTRQPLALLTLLISCYFKQSFGVNTRTWNIPNDCWKTNFGVLRYVYAYLEHSPLWRLRGSLTVELNTNSSDHLTNPSAGAGTTTFRLKWKGLNIFHDTWLERPGGLKRYLELDEVTDLDYIVISHAHFDQCVGKHPWNHVEMLIGTQSSWRRSTRSQTRCHSDCEL